MYWFLSFKCKNGDMEMEILNSYNNGYNKFLLSDFSGNIEEFEKRILDIMNCNVSLRDTIYLLCDIRKGVDDVFYNNFGLLSTRVKQVIDITSFNILNNINDENQWGAKKYTLEYDDEDDYDECYDSY